MVYMKVHRLTTITVANHKALSEAWRTFSESERGLIGRFIVEAPLTANQFRGLPIDLQGIVESPSVREAH